MEGLGQAAPHQEGRLGGGAGPRPCVEEPRDTSAHQWPPVGFVPRPARSAQQVRVLWRVRLTAGGGRRTGCEWPWPHGVLCPAGPGAAARPHRHHGGVQHRPDEQAGWHQPALLQLLPPPSW